MRACVRVLYASVRACVRASVRACERACVRACVLYTLNLENVCLI